LWQGNGITNLLPEGYTWDEKEFAAEGKYVKKGWGRGESGARSRGGKYKPFQIGGASVENIGVDYAKQDTRQPLRREIAGE